MHLFYSGRLYICARYFFNKNLLNFQMLNNWNKQIFHFKFKERSLKKSAKTATTSAAEQMIDIINFINYYGYVSGIEFTDDWKINYRLFITAFANLFGLCTEFYSIYYWYPDVKYVIVLGGVAYTSSVKSYWIQRLDFILFF